MRKLLTYLIILIAAAGCGEPKTSEEFIVGNILPELIDSLNISRINIIPPPPPPIYDIDSNIVGVDSVIAKSIFEKHEQDMRRIDSIDSRLLLGVVDSCLRVNWKDLEDRNYYDDNLCRDIVLHNIKEVVVAKKIVLNEISEPSGVQLMSISELKENYDDYRKIQNRKLGGTIAMSKVYFNKTREYGLIVFETQPFFNQGAGYYILIERNHGNWKVKRIYQSWIS